MQKLTSSEAQDLIKKAWEMVAQHTLGSYRFGQALQNLIPDEVLFNNEDTPYACLSESNFYYEQDPDAVIVKFYKWFVEDSNN